MKRAFYCALLWLWYNTAFALCDHFISNRTPQWIGNAIVASILLLIVVGLYRMRKSVGAR